MCVLSTGQKNLTARVCLLYVRRNQHGAGEKNRRILQTIVPGRVHSVQRAVLAVLFTKLNRPPAAADATSTPETQNTHDPTTYNKNAPINIYIPLHVTSPSYTRVITIYYII
jgi:hypothetical protein